MEEDKPITRKKLRKKTFKQMMDVPLRYLSAGAVAAGLSVVIYAGVQYIYQKATTDVANGIVEQGTAAESNGVLDNPAAAQSDDEIVQLRKASEGFRSVAKKIGPAVVNIKAVKTFGEEKRGENPFGRGKDHQSPDRPQDPFFDFFERFGQPFPFADPGPRTQESLGSGFIIDARGHIVTNNHVVSDATRITVMLADDDSTEHKAKIIGTDPKTDLAVIKIEAKKDLPVVEWANSEEVSVGDWAIAIGSPFTLSQSVTVGIVSAKGRSSRAIGAQYGSLIQTDAAINPGNSGGPLATLDGKVMGVNTAIYTRSGGYMGIGFAIPSDLAKDVVGKLIATGKVVRGWLGVYIQPASKELLKDLGIKDGVAVHQVMEDSPAEAAGIEAGDVVTEVQGKEVKDVNRLQETISGFKPGEKVPITVVSYSDKKKRTKTVKIGELPDEPTEVASGEKSDEEPDKLGLVVSRVEKGSGVKVEVVAPRSVAHGLLKEGDVIVRINRREVTSLSVYKKLVTNNKRLRLEVKRVGQRHKLFLEFTLPE